MSKRYSRFELPELQKKVRDLCKSFNYEAKDKDIKLLQINYNGVIAEKDEPWSLNLKLTAPEKVHSFIEQISLDFSDFSIDAPSINSRLTVLSLPVSYVRERGIDFFPANGQKFKESMSNKKFAQFVSEIKKRKDCFVLGEMAIPAVSGKTFVGRGR